MKVTMAKIQNKAEKKELSTRLIDDTESLINARLDHDISGYGLIIDYNRKLFNEIYDLDLFKFINYKLITRYCDKYGKCKKHLL